jgi:hypothetical protein
MEMERNHGRYVTPEWIPISLLPVGGIDSNALPENHDRYCFRFRSIRRFLLVDGAECRSDFVKEDSLLFMSLERRLMLP